MSQEIQMKENEFFGFLLAQSDHKVDIFYASHMDAWILRIIPPGMINIPYILYTQRGHIRYFKTLDSAYNLVNQHLECYQVTVTNSLNQ